MRFPIPSRAVPVVRWTASSVWRPQPVTWFTLLSGLAVFGIGEGLLVQSHYGATPWTVFAQGLSHQTKLSIGITTILTSAVLMFFWIPLRQPFGIGSIANAVVFPFFLDETTRIVHAPTSTAVRIGLLITGLVLFAFGASLYLSSGLGPGPRDGLMTGLQRRFDVPVARVRLGLEVLALTLGWLLGGHVGVGTALFAGCIGYLIAFFFTLYRHVAPATATVARYDA